jgi:hypothetical protein
MSDNNGVGNSISSLTGLAVSAGVFIFVAIPAFMGCGSQTSPINADMMRPDAWAWWMGSNICRSGKSLHEAFNSSVKPGGSTTVKLPDGTNTVIGTPVKTDAEIREALKPIQVTPTPNDPIIQQRNLSGSGDQGSRFKRFGEL